MPNVQCHLTHVSCHSDEHFVFRALLVLEPAALAGNFFVARARASTIERAIEWDPIGSMHFS